MGLQPTLTVRQVHRRKRREGGEEEEEEKRKRRTGGEEEESRTRGGGRGGEEEEEGYLDDVSDRQEVSSREDVVFVLLFFTLPLDDVNMRRSFSCIQLLLLLSTGNHLSVTSPLFNTTLFQCQ